MSEPSLYIAVNPLVIAVILPVSIIVGVLGVILLFLSRGRDIKYILFLASIVILIEMIVMLVFALSTNAYILYNNGTWVFVESPQHIRELSTLGMIISILSIFANILVFALILIEKSIMSVVRPWL